MSLCFRQTLLPLYINLQFWRTQVSPSHCYQGIKRFLKKLPKHSKFIMFSRLLKVCLERNYQKFILISRHSKVAHQNFVVLQSFRRSFWRDITRKSEIHCTFSTHSQIYAEEYFQKSRNSIYNKTCIDSASWLIT